MVFVIRDDDVNYFTNPEELENAYGEVWGICPPTFSVITHVKGNWKSWVKEIYRKKHDIDWNAWRSDDAIFPLANNRELVSFIKSNYKEGYLDISLHAIHHRNEDPIFPDSRTNNYVFGAEFLTSRDLTKEVRGALHYIHSNLGISVNTFTPPQNLMSLKGYDAIIHNKLNIVGAGIPFWKKELTLQGIKNMTKLIGFKVANPGKDYPYLLEYLKHKEVIHHYPLHPTTKLASLVESFEAVRRWDGVFVLSTHYHEFETTLSYDASRKMNDVFKDFMGYVLKCNIRFTSLSKLLGH